MFLTTKWLELIIIIESTTQIFSFTLDEHIYRSNYSTRIQAQNVSLSIPLGRFRILHVL